MLIATRSPEGGLWTWDGDERPPVQVAHAPDTAFALPLPDGRVVTLGGQEQGHLRLLERQGESYAVVAEVATGGGEPCHAALLPGGEHVALVNYFLDGSVAVVALAGGPDGGPVLVQQIVLDEPGAGTVPDRQEAPHPHFVLVVDAETVLVSDLGCDRIRRFSWREGRLEQTGSCATPPGSGPRHLAIHGAALVASAELSNEVLAAPLADVLGGEAEWQALPASRSGLSSAREGTPPLTHPGEIVVSSTGRVYVANRGADTLGVLDLVGLATLAWSAELPAGGAWPQHVMLQGDEAYVALRDANLVVGPRASASVPAPVWIAAP